MAEQLTGQNADTTDVLQSMITMVRVFLRDWEPINELIDGEESKDRDLALAVFRCLEDFNGTAPITSYTLADLISLHQYDLVIQGSACNVVQSVYLPYLRNQVQYSDAGVNISIQGKHQGFMQWYQVVKNEYEQKKRAIKNALNQEGMLSSAGGISGIPSEYWHLYSYFNNSLT